MDGSKAHAVHLTRDPGMISVWIPRLASTSTKVDPGTNEHVSVKVTC